jgi:serine O-acetyltransferase
MLEDVRAIYRNDPALMGNIFKKIEVILYPGLYAIVIHRYLSHPLYQIKIPFIPRLISQIMRLLTGIEIHPGAKIGRGFFIDHGMGVVIGGTAEIGRNCTLFHNVTLGGTGKHTGKRHPTIGDNVLIGTGSILLGPINVGSNVKIGADSTIINKNIPSNCTVVGTPARIVRLHGKKVNLKLNETKITNFNKLKLKEEK